MLVCWQIPDCLKIYSLFWDIVNYFKLMDFHKNLKIGLSSVGKMYIVSALLRIAHTLMETKLQNILIWSPRPLRSIFFRIPLGAHFLLISTIFLYLTNKLV